MSIKLFIAHFFMPLRVKRRELAQLFEITAEAFYGKKIRINKTAGIGELLEEYARYTKESSDRALQDNSNTEVIRKKLFAGAFEIGSRLRRELGIKNFHDFRTAARLIYRALEIDFSCDKNREVTVSKCFFSRFYSGQVCSLVSSLDSGLAAGLSGGLKMSFSERITENKPCCKARIHA